MIEKIGHIKNPLTVISIFAGIAEISGTIVLPFIASEHQGTYIWFLMLFPVYLVGLFFATLNFNRTALYSPSDYKDENNFINSTRRATPEELSNKLHQEVKEAESEIRDGNLEAKPNDQPGAVEEESKEAMAATTSETTTERKHVSHVEHLFPKFQAAAKHTRLIGELALAETLAINRLIRVKKIPFDRNVSVVLPDNTTATFDGVAMMKDMVHIAEVKFFPSDIVDVTRFHKSMIEAAKANSEMVKHGRKQLKFHAYIVANTSPAQLHRSKAELHMFASRLELPLTVHSSPMSELVKDIDFGD